MSYLAWPCCINGKPNGPNGKAFHMTLKYFGHDAPFSVNELGRLLAGFDTTPVSFRDQPHWAPAVFEFNGKQHHVLELTNPPERILQLHDAFRDIGRKADFEKYRPHVTVPDFWMEFIQKLGVGHVFLEFGPLALMGL